MDLLASLIAKRRQSSGVVVEAELFPGFGVQRRCWVVWYSCWMWTSLLSDSSMMLLVFWSLWLWEKGSGESRKLKSHIYPVRLKPPSPHSKSVEALHFTCRGWWAPNGGSRCLCPINPAAASLQSCHRLISSKSSSYLLIIEELRVRLFALRQLVASIASEML